MIELSIVVPLYNERGNVGELVKRCCAAARAVSDGFELLLVDDGSLDGTADEAERSGDLRVRVIRMPRNVGQFSALKAGLALAQGAHVVVLDGDLQDPPELIGELVSHARQTRARAVYAIKTSRREGLLFRAAQAVFHGIQGTLARAPIPSGASSYCLLDRDLAARLAVMPLGSGNVAAVVAALGVRGATLPYAKAARRDGPSRLGLAGHVREAVAALALTGAMARLGWVAGVLFAAGATATSALGGQGAVIGALAAMAAVAAAGAIVADRLVDRALAPRLR